MFIGYGDLNQPLHRKKNEHIRFQMEESEIHLQTVLTRD
jgi:hypothetical protein